MSSSNATEDYYMILEVLRTATSEQITKSYRRLALKFHPDRIANGGSTQAFQLLGQAYETLNDEHERREYDRIYPSIKRSQNTSQKPTSQKTQPSPPPPPHSPPPSTTHSDTRDDIAQISALRKAKEERNAKWRVTRNALESSIFELKRGIRRLKQEIEKCASLEADESAVEERARRPWSSSPRVNNSDEERARQDRIRQERWMAKNLKERRLYVQEGELLEKEHEMLRAKKRLDAENLRDDQAIQGIEARRRRGEAQGRRSREQEEQERQAKIRREKDEQRKKGEEQWKKQEEQRKMQDELRKKQEEQRRMQEEQRRMQEEQRRVQEEQRRMQEEQRKMQEQRRKNQEELRKKQDEQRKKQEEQWAREELAEALAETARQEEEERWQQRQRDCNHGVPKLPDEGMPEMSEGHATKVSAPTRRGKPEGQSKAKVSEAIPSRHTILAWLI
ncbi:hypothetical protein MBLNU13_g09636t1 [Cladosporium sp. NU13]